MGAKPRERNAACLRRNAPLPCPRPRITVLVMDEGLFAAADPFPIRLEGLLLRLKPAQQRACTSQAL